MEQKLYPSMTPSAPYLNSDVESMIDKQLAKVCSFNYSIQVCSFNYSIQNISVMMKYYEMEGKKYKKYTKCKQKRT